MEGEDKGGLFLVRICSLTTFGSISCDELGMSYYGDPISHAPRRGALGGLVSNVRMDTEQLLISRRCCILRECTKKRILRKGPSGPVDVRL
jgi:hypothetical protein